MLPAWGLRSTRAVLMTMYTHWWPGVREYTPRHPQYPPMATGAVDTGQCFCNDTSLPPTVDYRVCSFVRIQTDCGFGCCNIVHLTFCQFSQLWAYMTETSVNMTAIFSWRESCCSVCRSNREHWNQPPRSSGGCSMHHHLLLKRSCSVMTFLEHYNEMKWIDHKHKHSLL